MSSSSTKVNLVPLSSIKRPKREVSNKWVELEIDSKAGSEFLSGRKKDSTTVSRSPQSDEGKKEQEEITKSAISNFDLPRNPGDIRSYFISKEPEKKLMKTQIFKIKRQER